MTAFGFVAVFFLVIGLGLILRAITYTPKASPNSGQSGAPVSGRDGAHIVATRTTATADNPPGPTSMRDPNTRGRPSAS